MKKSILLSATIMLIILFVTLTTTTFAWYQASAGEITISGSSTANVTTSAPEDPKLYIGAINSPFTSDDMYDISFPNEALSLPILYFNNPTLTNSKITSVELTKFFNPFGQELHPFVHTFEMKNMSTSFDLTANFNVYNGVSGNPATPALLANDNYRYIITIQPKAGGDIQIRNSAFYYLDNSSIVQTYQALDTDFVFVHNTTYTVNFYFWIDDYYLADQTINKRLNSSTIPDALSTIKLEFGNINIQTS